MNFYKIHVIFYTFYYRYCQYRSRLFNLDNLVNRAINTFSNYSKSIMHINFLLFVYLYNVEEPFFVKRSIVQLYTSFLEQKHIKYYMIRNQDFYMISPTPTVIVQYIYACSLSLTKQTNIHVDKQLKVTMGYLNEWHLFVWKFRSNQVNVEKDRPDERFHEIETNKMYMELIHTIHNGVHTLRRLGY